jgi:miniconductance mechanosensitive channel
MLTIYLTNLFLSFGLSKMMSHNLAYLTILCIIIVLALIISLIFKHVLLKIFHSVVTLTANKWDDAIIENGVHNSITLIIPAVVIFYFVNLLFPAKSSSIINFIQLICLIYIIIVCVVILNSILNSIVQIYNRFEMASHTPIKSFVQMFKVIIVIVAMIIIISIIMQKSPWTLLKALGALTAVSMLIFKDSILGLVAGIQLSAQKMVRKGDWITMPKFDADGDVIDISLTTVKVQNFDKTIVSVPTYALVTNSFQNWRGMAESGGRRIKRSINLDMNTFKFLDENDINRLKKFEYLEEYLNSKSEELNSHNKKLRVNITDSAINGRRLTNIGTFRFYIKQYLKHNTNISCNMTFIVRQLQPTEKGLPLQVYVFTNNTNWVNYEGIQADIFDHILTAVPEFGLSIYQDPTGLDFRKAYIQKSRT